MENKLCNAEEDKVDPVETKKIENRFMNIERKLIIAQDVVKLCRMGVSPKECVSHLALKFVEKDFRISLSDFMDMNKAKKETFNDLMTSSGTSASIIPASQLPQIMHIIQCMYLNKTFVTETVLEDIKNKLNPPLINVTAKDIVGFLKQNGFVFKKVAGTKHRSILEKPEQIFERISFLKQILNYKKDKIPVVYVESSTVVVTGVIRPVVMVMSPKEGLINYHYNLSQNFLRSSLKIMYENIFTRYGKSVIVFQKDILENTTFCITPKEHGTKANIIRWLCDHNIPCDNIMRKAELYALVCKFKHICNIETHLMEESMNCCGHFILLRPHYLTNLSYSRLIFRHSNFRFEKLQDFQFELSRKVSREDWMEQFVNLTSLEQIEYDLSLRVELAVDDMLSKYSKAASHKTCYPHWEVLRKDEYILS